MNNEEVRQLLAALPSLDNLEGLDFFYELSKIEDSLRSENKHIQKTLISIKELDEYEKERDILIKGYAEKDEKGRPIRPTPNSYKVDSSVADNCNTDIKILDEKYKSSLDQKKTLLEQASKAKFKKIKLSLVPKNISGAQFRSIKHLIEK